MSEPSAIWVYIRALFSRLLFKIKALFQDVFRDIEDSNTLSKTELIKRHSENVKEVTLTSPEAGDLIGIPSMRKTPYNVQDPELGRVVKRVRKVTKEVVGKPPAYNDPIENGRSLKWFSPGAAKALERSNAFLAFQKQLAREGWDVRTKVTSGIKTSAGRHKSTRVHIKRKSK